ncbi:hypothetical protein E4T49_02905 [Aureobasidium sp. EXF-10728]|nr:hypothetical protein E4T49_02905 [Aureobasidium sp. EXF-10728]
MVWDKYNRSNGGVTIDFYPNTFDNISWSKESIIAVGGSDHVPRLKAIASDERRWDKINLKTSFFTLEDIQLQLPLSWKNFSIGEEMSESFVHALDWSPPGSGKHRRSVLAVLTSNHVLSIWECVGKPEIATDWVRACVVNHALQAHYKEKDVQTSEESEHDHFERLRAKQRIRAFAWSPAVPDSSLSGASGDCTTRSPYLAVSNDRGEVLIIELQTPHNILEPRTTSWNLSVAASFGVEVPDTKKSALSTCLPVTFKWRSPFVDQLAWSPWALDSANSPTSVLAFTTQSSLQCKNVKIDDGSSRVDVTTGAVVSLMEEIPDTQAAGFQPGLNLEFQVSAQEINTPWDEIAGMTFVQDDNENISVQIAYHLGSGTDRITSLALPFTPSSGLGSTNWQHDLLRGQRRFSDELNLAGNVIARAYGLCTSPFGDLVAVNVSFHPSDGLEYTTNSDEVSYLITSQCNDDLQFALAGSPSNAYELTAEALLSSLQSLAMREPEALADHNFVIEQVLQALDLSELPSTSFNQGQITEDTPIELVLLKYVKADIPKTPPLDATVVLKIVSEISRLPHFVADASLLSTSIMQIHCLILAKLQARAGNADADASTSEEEEIERCEICHNNIPFESLRWARCVNNHQYPRCTLSFLAIQTPGTAKSCSICNAQYMNEFMIPGFKTKDSNETGADEVDGDEVMQGTIDQEPPYATTRIPQHNGHYLGGTTEQFQSNCGPERRIPTPPSPRSPVEPTDFERYQQLTREACKSGFDSDEDSYIGSVEEMTPVRPARRSNMLVDGLFHNSSPHVLEEESPILPKHQDLAVAHHIKEVHLSTMQALTGITGSSNPPPTPPPLPIRDSRYQDWRNSRYRSVSAPAKKVTMAPPPIDTSRISQQQPHVKTPYPFRAIHRKEFGRQFSASTPALRSPHVHDSLLTLSIRRSNPNSRFRLSTLTIPANSEFSAVKNGRHSSDRGGKEYTPQDFDDAELFRQLRQHYQKLLGPWRHFSARSLTMICVSGDASKQADSGYGWLLTPRSPRTLAHKGLNDTFSEEKLLRFFRDPSAAGKSRYAWVSWAHRLADAPAITTPLPLPSASPITAPDSARTAATASTVNNRFSMIRRAEQHEGLEFVVSWSVRRILLALSVVLLLSLAATLLWVFLGKGSHFSAGQAGFLGAGDRVVAGVVIGICVLLIGCFGVVGWIGVSWLVL